MNPTCLNLVFAAVFLCSWAAAQEDFSQFEQQFKQLSESLGGGGGDLTAGAGAANASAVPFGGMQNDAPAGQQPVDQPAPVEPTRAPKPEEASTFPPLARQEGKTNSTEKPADAVTTTPKSTTTPKGDGGADFTSANLALVLGVACVLHLLY